MTPLWGRSYRVRLRGQRHGDPVSGVVHYRRGGDPSSPLKVLWVHGVGLTWVTWRRVLPALDERADCVAIDMLGFGDSRADAGSRLDVGGQTTLIEPLLDHLGWSRVVMVGHSMGGGVALGTAMTWPRRVRALALVGSIGTPQAVPPLFWPCYLPGAHVALCGWFTGLYRLGRVERMARRYGYDIRSAESFTESMTHLPVARAFVEAVRQLRPSLFQRFHHLLPRVDQPTLIVHGDRDNIVPPHVPAELAQLLPAAQLHWIRGGHHMPQESRPQQVAETILNYLDRLTG